MDTVQRALEKGDYHEGVVKTNCDCTSCGKIFVAKINYDLDGNHKILCPYCGHEHYRVIKKGFVTGQRWDSQAGPNRPVSTERMWSDRTVGIETNTAAEYIRRKFIPIREQAEIAAGPGSQKSS